MRGCSFKNNVAKPSTKGPAGVCDGPISPEGNATQNFYENRFDDHPGDVCTLPPNGDPLGIGYSCLNTAAFVSESGQRYGFASGALGRFGCCECYELSFAGGGNIVVQVCERRRPCDANPRPTPGVCHRPPQTATHTRQCTHKHVHALPHTRTPTNHAHTTNARAHPHI